MMLLQNSLVKGCSGDIACGEESGGILMTESPEEKMLLPVCKMCSQLRKINLSLCCKANLSFKEVM